MAQSKINRPDQNNGNEREQKETEEKKSQVRIEAPQPKKYERIRETEIPQEVIKLFNDHGWNLRFIRFEDAGTGRIDNKYLAKRMKQDGYEFVKVEELPDWYLSFFEEREIRGRNDALVSGDVVLMKNPLQTRDERREAQKRQTQEELNAVDVNVLRKNRGFIDTGSKSSVTHKEPRFQEQDYNSPFLAEVETN